MVRQLLCSLSVISMIALLGAPQAFAQEPLAPFNYGDLTIDDLTQDEIEAMAFGERELFSRAKTKAQLLDYESRRVQIVVNKSMKERGYQFVSVFVDGELKYEAPVSTAWERMAKAKTKTYFAFTPVGKFFPDSMHLKRYSFTWKVWLSNVIPFSDGVWLHATTPDHFKELGAPASGGCVRVHPVDAQEIYKIVEENGMHETAITVLAADSDEKQVPWTVSKIPMPSHLIQWRKAMGVEK